MDSEIERSPREGHEVRRRLSQDDRSSWASQNYEAPAVKSEGPGDDVDRRWSVAFLASLAGLVAVASIRTSGFFFVRFRKEFGGSASSREAAAWPLSILEVCSHMGGFPAAYLAKRLDAFQVAVVGSVLLWAGLALASLARNVFWMCLTFGFVHGGGAGLVLVSLDKIVMVSFNRYRGVANGMKCAGYSVSSFIFVRLLSEVDEAWGFHWTLLFFALASTLATGFCCMLLRISKKHRASSVRQTECFCGRNSAYGRKSLPFLEIDPAADARKAQYPAKNDSEAGGTTRIDRHTDDFINASRHGTRDPLIQCEQEKDQVFPVVKELVGFEGRSKKADRDDGLHLLSTGTTTNAGSSFVRGLNSVFRLFSETTFCFLMVSSVVSCFSSFVFYGTVVDYAIDKGATRMEAEWNIVSCSGASLVGSFCVPALADRGYVGRWSLVTLAMFFLASSLMWVPRVTTVGQYELAAMSAAAWIGALMNMRIVLLADYVPDQLLTLCLGLCGALFAPVALYCPAMIGYYRDNAGSYNDLYELLGLLQASVGVAFLGLLCFSKHGKVHEEIPRWKQTSNAKTSASISTV